ncbi:DNA-3-methyladenine glycosylase II [Kluyveromyces lactis]|uniref:KLLA0E10363p n=1 Tax=Kluyveromyces lactis (strain ATCC 8585 / CBS 2359 / DSM 70799 / NBRC 1267 / NRRL Y-1140 / WM37) TaxID=284590 RepID=Q6CNS2_KLULA|nr:uncharacterized protein KLLA0_E10363g [Kluyveromyces lactis]CAG99504.1 KLLA0E10363p [Kluyveromyces lactis]|eukprot:XP_454417.1 uncharacterized protein KLLA0_E10363g [Kluyveromyces lactis]
MKRTRDDILKVDVDQEYLDQHIDSFRDGIEHILTIDPTLKEIIEHSPFTMFLKENVAKDSMDLYFNKLAGSIISQQISGAAAKNIRGRIVDMFDGTFPNYQTLHETFQDSKKKQAFKECGLSQRKLMYIESLVGYFFNNEDSIKDLFAFADDDKIIEELVANIKGIGPWSAKMFLVTGLHRLNVFAAEDLGIARGCSRYLEQRPEILKKLHSKRTLIKKSKIKHKSFKWKIHDEDVVELCGDLFSPHRTLFMFVLWRMSDTNMEVVINNEKRFMSK